MSKLPSAANFLRARVMPALRRRWANVSSTPRPNGLSGMSRQRQYQLRHKSAGLCRACSRPVAHGALFCELHRRKRNLKNREWARKRFKRKIRYHNAESYKFGRRKAYKPVDANGNKVAVPAPQVMLNGFLKAQTRVAQLEGTVERLAATVKEQAAEIQKMSAQLELSNPHRKRF